MKKTIYCEITKSEDSENGDFITVGGIASSNIIDSDGEIITTEAMAKAREAYLKFPAIREMHQAIAAGKCTKFEILENGDTYIEAEIYDKETIKKIKAGVLRAFSIGGRALKKLGNTIIDLLLSEISVVDRPANPNAIMTFFKADMDLYKENNMSIENIQEPQAQEPVATPEVVEPTAPVAEVPSVAPVVEKSLEDVARLALLVQELTWLQGNMNWEESYEAEPSSVPSQLKEAIKTLFGILNQSVVEETTELTDYLNDTNKADNLTSHIENDKLNNNAVIKAGSRNSKEDSERIQKIHDLVIELGATPASGLPAAKNQEVDLKKFADNENTLKQNIVELENSVTVLKARIAELEKVPAPASFHKSDFGNNGEVEVEPVYIGGKIDEQATAIKKSFGYFRR